MDWDLVIDGLQELAGPALRARLWLATGDGEVSSLEECKSRLFDDSGLGSALEKGATGLDDTALGLLRGNEEALRRVDVRRPAPLLLADARVHWAGERAQVLLRLLEPEP